jgi:membrane protease YdiL (CAAX protease family)
MTTDLPRGPAAPPPDLQAWRARMAALGEVLFVLLAVSLAARLLLRAAGFTDADTFLFPQDGPPDFTAAAAAEARWHLVRYGTIAMVVLLVGWVRQRHSLASYGLGKADRSVGALVRYGLIIYAVIHLPTLLIGLVDRVYDLGPGLPFWDLMERVEWDGGFWLFMAVSSFAVVPVVEELTARGYLLGRLRESFSPGGALLVTGAIFAAAHTQYHQPDAYAIANLLLLGYGSVILGYSVLRTGSLIPAITAHALVNVPVAPALEPALLAALMIIIWLGRQPIGQGGQRLISLLRATDDLGPVGGAAGLLVLFAVTLTALPLAPYAWLVVFLVAFVDSLRTRPQHRNRGTTAAESSDDP